MSHKRFDDLSEYIGITTHLPCLDHRLFLRGMLERFWSCILWLQSNCRIFVVSYWLKTAITIIFMPPRHKTHSLYYRMARNIAALYCKIVANTSSTIQTLSLILDIDIPWDGSSASISVTTIYIYIYVYTCAILNGCYDIIKCITGISRQWQKRCRIIQSLVYIRSRNIKCQWYIVWII